ncbi:hypothetical protein HK103_003052, partial [Boothiomyces macroporosus]
MFSNLKIYNQCKKIWQNCSELLSEMDATKKRVLFGVKPANVDLIYELVQIELAAQKDSLFNGDLKMLKQEEMKLKIATETVKKQEATCMKHFTLKAKKEAAGRNTTNKENSYRNSVVQANKQHASLATTFDRVTTNATRFAQELNTFNALLYRKLNVPLDEVRVTMQPSEYLPKVIQYLEYPYMLPIDLVFGVPLEMSYNGSPEVILNQLYAKLEEKGSRQEGIYRTSAKPSDIEFFKSRVESAGECPINFVAIHCDSVAATIKTFFRQLPKDLVAYPAVERIQNSALPVADRIARIKEKLERLPDLNAKILKDLLHHLK